METRRFRTVAALVAVVTSGTSPALLAQADHGISLGLTPTAERVFFSRDLLLEDETFVGGRLSLNFGRFVALEGHYLTDTEGTGREPLGEVAMRRYGGDLVFTFARTPLTPFLRAGAAVNEFEPADASATELLSASLGGGVRFDLFRRLQTQVYVQDLAHRVGPTSVLLAEPGMAGDEASTAHSLSAGAGLNFYLGGYREQPETDAVFEGRGGLAFPIQFFAGQFRFADDFLLPNEAVVGARLGLEVGPYVGLGAYYFGSAEDDFQGFDDFYGYGLESSFNLTASDTPLTPYLLLGAGRLQFTEAQMELAGLDEDRKWTATLGGGIAVNLSERLRIEASARDLLIARVDAADVTAPDQIESNWLFSGGIRYTLGGSTGREEPRRPEEGRRQRPGREVPGPEAAEGAGAEEEREAAARVEAEERRRAETEVEPTAIEGEPLAEAPARAADSEAAPAEAQAAPVAVSAETGAVLDWMRLPVLDRGEIYIRFGESGTFERRADGPPVVVIGGQAPAALGEGRPPVGGQVPPTGAEVGGQIEPTRVEEGLAAARAARLEARIDSLAAALVAAGALRAAPVEGGAPRTGRDARLEARIDSVAVALEDVRERRAEARRRAPDRPAEVRLEIVEPPEERTVVVVEAPDRGIFRGEPARVAAVGVYTGASFHEPEQLLLGTRVDIGSALGGSIRVVPELTVGVTDSVTVNLNGHLLWPLPVTVERARPFIGSGFGLLLGEVDTQILIPNVLFGATYPLGGFEAFGAFQGLDLFDESRLVMGLSRPLGASRSTVRRVRRAGLAEAEREPLVGAPAGPGRAPPDTAAIAGPSEEEERRLREEESRLETELERLRERLEDTQREAREAAARAESEIAAARARAASLRDYETVRDLIRLPSVSGVRLGDRGLTLVVGGPGVFGSGRHDLSSQAAEDLARVAGRLVALPDVALAVEGHTDGTGSQAVNGPLSERRARSVEAALLAHGVGADRITSAGFGEARPVADNDTSEGRALNRRVEIVLLGFFPPDS